MEISNIFKNSLSYPLNDYVKLIILGVISIISNISSIYNSVGGGNYYVSTILGIIGIIVSFIVAGYILSIIKETIGGSDNVPAFEWKNNFIMGIKYLILSIVYLIIPTIIVVIVAWCTGLIDSGMEIYGTMSGFAAANSTAMNQTVATIPQPIWDTLITSASLTVIVAIILYILFGFFAMIGECRLADTGSLSEGLSIGSVIKDISAIGWGNFIIWFIILLIILFILAVIFGIISLIPYIGAFIAALIIGPFIAMFMARAMGLIYASK